MFLICITYSDAIYEFSKPLLKFLDWHKGPKLEPEAPLLHRHIVLVGAHRLGQHLVASLEKMPEQLVIVDINPEVVAQYEAAGVRAVCGDITESYIQEQVNLPQARVVISTIPNFQDNLALLEAVKRKSANQRIKPRLIFAAQNEFEAKRLYEQEIDYALSPHFIGGQHLAKILRGKALLSDLKKLRQDHLKVLSQ